MIGLHPIAAGAIRILDRNLPSADRRKPADEFPYHACGVSFQGGALFGSRTILENVRLPLEEFTHPSRLARMNFVALTKLRMVDLESASQNFPPNSPAACKNARPSPALSPSIPRSSSSMNLPPDSTLSPPPASIP